MWGPVGRSGHVVGRSYASIADPYTSPDPLTDPLTDPQTDPLIDP